MLRFVILGSAVLALSATSCSAEPVRSKRRGSCPEGTMVIQGKYCVPVNWMPCPEGFEYDASRKACVFLCPDTSIDAEPSPFCPPDGGAGDGAIAEANRP